MPNAVRLTVLSDMAGDTPAEQARQAAAWGLRTLDLKTVGGKNVADLTDAEADVVADALARHGVGVEAFSTNLLNRPIESGPAAFAADRAALERVLDLARRLRPRAIRLIAAQTTRRAEVADSFDYVREGFPWLVPLYADAVERIADTGLLAVIENESAGSIFSRPHETAAFFDALGRSDKVRLTWDVQNMWQLGTFPTLEAYRVLRPHVGYLHLKGGVAGEDGRTLQWRSGLEAASWPVLEIVRAVIADGVSPAICLNPSHGTPHPDYAPADYAGDLAYLRRHLGQTVGV